MHNKPRKGLFIPTQTKDGLNVNDLEPIPLTNVQFCDSESEKNVKDICWHIPLDGLLDTFIQVTRRNQLLVVQPASAAMIYAVNSKPGCYTGFFENSRVKKSFNYLDFIIT